MATLRNRLHFEAQSSLWLALLVRVFEIILFENDVQFNLNDYKSSIQTYKCFIVFGWFSWCSLLIIRCPIHKSFKGSTFYSLVVCYNYWTPFKVRTIRQTYLESITAMSRTILMDDTLLGQWALHSLWVWTPIPLYCVSKYVIVGINKDIIVW